MMEVCAVPSCSEFATHATFLGAVQTGFTRASGVDTDCEGSTVVASSMEKVPRVGIQS